MDPITAAGLIQSVLIWFSKDPLPFPLQKALDTIPAETETEVLPYKPSCNLLTQTVFYYPEKAVCLPAGSPAPKTKSEQEQWKDQTLYLPTSDSSEIQSLR